jgi:hypothetical protein
MSAWQTKKVYRAEHAVAHFGEPLSVLEAERFIVKVKNSVWWKNRTNVANVNLIIQGDAAGKDPWAGAVKESWKKGRLWLHARKLYLDNILHELAHILSWPKFHHPTHDKDWVGVYLHLLRAWTSEGYTTQMEKAFIEEGVEWNVYG